MIEATKVAAILLAAGRSERFGTDKLLAMIAGEPVAVRAARALLSIGPQWRIAVCRQGSPLTNPLETLGFEIALNPDPARGLSSSLALGIERAAKAGADAALAAVTTANTPGAAKAAFVSIAEIRPLAIAEPTIYP